MQVVRNFPEFRIFYWKYLISGNFVVYIRKGSGISKDIQDISTFVTCIPAIICQGYGQDMFGVNVNHFCIIKLQSWKSCVEYSNFLKSLNNLRMDLKIF